MGKLSVSSGWVLQGYRYEVDRPVAHLEIPSHTGGRRYAWNWAKRLVEDQLHLKDAFRTLALRQGASTAQADAYAEEIARLQMLVAMNEERRKDHEEKVARGERKGAYRPVSESVPWSAEAMRYIWNRVKDEVAPWWEENSKECYSSGFEALGRAFGDYFASRDGERAGPRVGWPRYKGRGGRQSVSFTTGAIKVLDRHHVQLPVVGVLRVKETTDKLRLPLARGEARILRATLVSEGARTHVSFAVVAKRGLPEKPAGGVAGHDVGVHLLVTSSDGHVAENPRAAAQAKQRVSRYQRRMDRQHRSGSPACFNSDGTHIEGACHWHRSTRSKRAKENQGKLQRAHGDAANIRRDAIHKKSHHDATSYRVNILEGLNVKGMGKRGAGKRGFDRVLADAALAEYRRQMSYKCPWYNSLLFIAARWYPSSKLCSACRTRRAKLSRSARVFTCESCGLSLDRDLNAARNLAALAELACVCLLAQLSTGIPVDWSHLPVMPDGWKEPSSTDTRSSRGCARAGGRGNPVDDGGEGKTARARKDGDASFDREATEPPAPPGALMSEVA